jgi:hypothetical protein
MTSTSTHENDIDSADFVTTSQGDGETTSTPPVSRAENQNKKTVERCDNDRQRKQQMCPLGRQDVCCHVMIERRCPYYRGGK